MPYNSSYPSESIPVLLRYREANVNADPAATWHMTTTNDAKASQIDRQGIYTVKGDNGTDGEKKGRYVVWDRSGAL